jgi:hypothetical protein
MALGFKTRYGFAVNPFANPTGAFVPGTNQYMRATAISDIF